jgi:hypothetical protein
MKRRDFLQEWGLSSLKIKLGFLEGEFAPQDPDRAAAGELYVELLTRVTTQYLAPEDGDRKDRPRQRVRALPADPRNSAASRFELRRIRQTCHPSTQSDHPALHGEMAPALPNRRVW